MRRLLGVLALLSLFAVALPALADGLPAAAQRHRADLIRSARAVWGLDAPTATFAAQIHAESLWRADAVSPAGAEGIAQFMPRTADWMAQTWPALVERDPFNPAWGLRALVSYDRYLWQRVQAADACERMAMTLSAYNGGLSWVYRDQRLAAYNAADSDRWFDHVERFNSGRRASAFRENRAYPRKILLQLEPRYRAAGWGPGACP